MTIEEAIKSEMSGDTQKAFLALGNTVESLSLQKFTVKAKKPLN